MENERELIVSQIHCEFNSTAYVAVLKRARADGKFETLISDYSFMPS